MSYTDIVRPGFQVKKEIYVLLALLGAASVYARVITSFPFPKNVIFLFWPILLVVFLFDMRRGIVVWLFASALGNNLTLSLPGIPALRPSHIGLLFLFVVWLIKSHRVLPSALARFWRDAKNRALILMLGWAALSMVMARLEGITQQNVDYQLDALLTYTMPFLLLLVVSNSFDGEFFNKAILATVAFSSVTMLIMLSSGVIHGVSVTGWKSYVEWQVASTVSWATMPVLLPSLVFFKHQRWMGKIILSFGILISLVLYGLQAAGGHRSSILEVLITFGFFFLFTMGKKRAVFLGIILAIATPVAVWSASDIQSWVSVQTERDVNLEEVSIGNGSRLNLAGDSFQIIKGSPLWGTGSDFYRLHSNLKLMYPGGILKPAATPHDSWLQVAADHGIPALLLLVVFCGLALRDGWHLLRLTPDSYSRAFVLCFLCTLCVAMVDSFISSGEIWPVFTGSQGDETATLAGSLLGFWFYYGLMLGAQNQHRNLAGAYSVEAGQAAT